MHRTFKLPRLSRQLITAMAAVLVAIGVAATPASAAASTGVVIGLGDSIAAGFFAGPPASSPYAVACARSTQAYPSLVAATLGFSGYNLACAGASEPAGVNGPQTIGGATVPPQLQQIKALPHASLATVTILANDLRWTQFLTECIDPTTNCATVANTAAFRTLLTLGGVRLAYTLHVLNAKADHVAITGYYNPMGTLAVPVFGLAPTEANWVNARLADLNSTLRIEAALFSHTSYVDITSLDPTLGDIQLAGTGIFHPTVLGQTKIGGAVVANYQSS